MILARTNTEYSSVGDDLQRLYEAKTYRNTFSFLRRQVEFINFRRVVEGTGNIVPGTLGNLCVDVRDSKVTSTHNV